MHRLMILLLYLALLQGTLSAKQDNKQISKIEDFSTKTNDQPSKSSDSYLPRRVVWPGKNLSPAVKKLGAVPPPEKPPADEFPVRLSVDDGEHPLRKDSEPLKRNIVMNIEDFDDVDADNSWTYYASYLPYYSYYYYWPYYYYYGRIQRYRYVPYFNKYWSRWSNYYAYPYSSYYDNYYDWYRKR